MVGTQAGGAGYFEVGFGGSVVSAGAGWESWVTHAETMKTLMVWNGRTCPAGFMNMQKETKPCLPAANDTRRDGLPGAAADGVAVLGAGGAAARTGCHFADHFEMLDIRESTRIFRAGQLNISRARPENPGFHHERLSFPLMVCQCLSEDCCRMVRFSPGCDESSRIAMHKTRAFRICPGAASVSGQAITD